MGKESSHEFDSFEIANAIRLSGDTTIVVVRDYFPLIDKIDSIISPTLS